MPSDRPNPTLFFSAFDSKLTFFSHFSPVHDSHRSKQFCHTIQHHDLSPPGQEVRHRGNCGVVSVGVLWSLCLSINLGVYRWPQCNYNKIFCKTYDGLSKITTGNRCQGRWTLQNLTNLNLRDPDMLTMDCWKIRFFIGNDDESRDLSPQCFKSRDRSDFENIHVHVRCLPNLHHLSIYFSFCSMTFVYWLHVPKNWSSWIIFFRTIVCVYFLLMLVATVYDIIVVQLPKSSEKEGAIFNGNANLQHKISVDENSPLLGKKPEMEKTELGRLKNYLVLITHGMGENCTAIIILFLPVMERI